MKEHKYPTVITDGVLARLSSISDAEVERDIKDTEAEVINLEKEVKGNGLIFQANRGFPSGRMAVFMRDAKKLEIENRQKFITFLKAVQEKRKDVEEK